MLIILHLNLKKHHIFLDGLLLDIKQWGYWRINNGGSFNYNISFNTACYNVNIWEGGAKSSKAMSFAGISMEQTTKTSVTAYVADLVGSSNPQIGNALWLAIGK